ncbi:C2 family cysteine protease [Fimbriiglobus ruber]|uniref:OmpB protein n=1 Tax=Fimbriiglobus ruber TaxID=1908690 RepID=A0A225D607_9BACT|nr:C2 family cysteine protease [Fimbriiglobus ruber]OWK36413.1 OmpB protein [Fimbriiglobus ruber]
MASPSILYALQSGNLYRVAGALAGPGQWTDLNGGIQSFAMASPSTLYALQSGNLYRVDGALAGPGQWTDLNGGVQSLNDVPVANVPYIPANGILFGPDGPSYLDVQQGNENDCWLIASLAEVAARAPLEIEKMFTYIGTEEENGSVVGLYTVRFFNNSGTPEYVTIDTELPAGGSYYDRPTNGVLWVALAEKAYAAANAAGFVTTCYKNVNSYDALGNLNNSGGLSSWALQAITGQTIGSTTNLNNVASDWNAGSLIVLGTSKNKPTDSDKAIEADHAYAVVGYDESSGMFLIMNPWGTDSAGWAPGLDNQVYGLFSTSQEVLLQNFSEEFNGISTASGLAQASLNPIGLTVQWSYTANPPTAGANMQEEPDSVSENRSCLEFNSLQTKGIAEPTEASFSIDNPQSGLLKRWHFEVDYEM